MSRATELTRAVLCGRCQSDADARAVLDRALELEVDPFDYFAHRLGVSYDDILRRAAHWAGLAFSPVVPAAPMRPETAAGLANLGLKRTIRAPVSGRDILFLAPTFTEVLDLRSRVEAFPEVQRRLCLVPPSALRSRLGAQYAEPLLVEARTGLVRRWPYASAYLELGRGVRLAFALFGLALIPAVLSSPNWLQPVLMLVTLVLIAVPSVARMIAALSRSAGNEPPPRRLSEAELPVYSVLIPLRDEAGMIGLLHRAMDRLDYPPEKLDIKFVVEARSASTIAAVAPVVACDPRFELISVPDGEPRTKPKALNFALPFVRGEFVTVFDAEDVPDSDQLLLAASTFAARPELGCLQAELVVENASENWLTALFASEYAGQFGLLLPALARWNLPLPLGGTSNHFRVDWLRQLGGWDAHNVTEDADLGMRLARMGLRSATLASRTLEEAPVTIGPWMRQRTRWMKGWMTTFIVHNRHPRRFLDEIGWRGFLAFQIYLLNVILSPLLHTLFIVSILLWVLFGRAPLMLDSWGLVSISVLVIGYAGAIALTFAGLRRLGLTHLIRIQLGLPLYWVLHSLATLLAVFDLVGRPFFWAKTEHGRTRLDRLGLRHAPQATGRKRRAGVHTG